MSQYLRTVTIHGIPITVHQCCPFDGLTNIAFPVYLNNINPSGLIQPYGPINDEGVAVSGGIVRPAQPSGVLGPLYEAAPSGLSHTYTMGYAMGTDGFGLDQHTNYWDINYYQAYWTCPSGHYFVAPSGLSTDFPTGYSVGNVGDASPPPFGNFQ